MKRPIIIVEGSIPGCIHYERIVGFIGTCWRCGQVRDYGPCYSDDGDSLSKKKARKGQAVLRERRKVGVYD